MSRDLETFLAACSKKDYRVDFKLPEGGSVEVAPVIPVIPEPVVVVPEPEVIVPPAVVEPEVVEPETV